MKPKTLRSIVLLLHDQLCKDISALQNYEKSTDLIVCMECPKWFSNAPHHKLKLAYIISCYRHFYQNYLNASNNTYNSLYLDLENVLQGNHDMDNKKPNYGDYSFKHIMKKFIHPKYNFEQLVVTQPNEYHILEDIMEWHESINKTAELVLLEDNRFFCNPDEFLTWKSTHKQHIRMENFYRQMRVQHKILMQANGKDPIGNQWNFDKMNRKSLNHITVSDAKLYTNDNTFKTDKITEQAIQLVDKYFANYYGLAYNENHKSAKMADFQYAVTETQAMDHFREFLSNKLSTFGDYQDAMQTDQYHLFHSVISMYLNNGLLNAKDVCYQVEKAYHASSKSKLSLNSVEGYIRQILGWREYMRLIYLTHMPKYASMNALDAHNHLPAYFWLPVPHYKIGDLTKPNGVVCRMNCVNQVLKQTYEIAYAHHIQRLMITGNICLLLGIEPSEVCEWYLAVYADAYDWVEMPNTLGMSQYADGGIIASKPYVSSGSYINKMSDYCKTCYYNVTLKVDEETGEKMEPKSDTDGCSKRKIKKSIQSKINATKHIKLEKMDSDDENASLNEKSTMYGKKSPYACPYNFLYWNFFMKHEKLLAGSGRIGFMYKNLRNMNNNLKTRIKDQAQEFITINCGKNKNYNW